MKFKPLLDRWKKDPAPARTAKEYAIRLDLDDAARLHALAELFPGQPIEVIVTDLLHAALDEIAAAMPYERGPQGHFARRPRRPGLRGHRPYAAFRRTDPEIQEEPQGCRIGSWEIGSGQAPLDAAALREAILHACRPHAFFATLGGGALALEAWALVGLFHLVRRYPEPISASKPVVGFLLSARFAGSV